MPNKSSKYAVFETKTNKIVSIRISNHNATVSNFDNHGEADGISIVVSDKVNKGITNDGSAHVEEYFYPEIKLRKADNKPLSEIIKSLTQSLYSGEYKDSTGIAQKEEVNIDGAQFLRTPNGEVYGFVKNGKIYLDPALLNPNTPIHEYTHLWDTAIREKNPELWNRGKELMKRTPLWEEVKNNPAYADIAEDEDLLASEVHARLTGKDSEKLLSEMEREADKSIVNKLREWLKEALQWVKDTLTPWTTEEAEKISLEDFARMPIRDLMQGKDIRAENSTGVIQKMATEARSTDIKNAPENRTTNSKTKRGGTVVPKSDAAKVINNLLSLSKEYEKSSNDTRGLLTNIAIGIGVSRKNASDYKTFELQDGNGVVRLRVSNHNATASNFEKDGVSIVVSRGANKGLRTAGNSDVVEFFYSDKELKGYSGAPISKIVEDIANLIEKGEYNNTIPATYINSTYTDKNGERKTRTETSLDYGYRKAVEQGDMKTARKMLAEEAERKGYSTESDYQGTSAFNGAAPSGGWYNTRKEAINAIENEEYDGDVSMDLAFDFPGNFPLDDEIHAKMLAYHQRRGEEFHVESIKAIRAAREDYKAGNKNATIKMYRSVPVGVKEDSFRNGDWITPSRSYSEDNANIHAGYEGENEAVSWDEEGNARIIEMEVPITDVWWDQNDINEWGYDDGKSYTYKNTKNNRKLYDVTYNDNGDLIPLSERFSESSSDIRFRRSFGGNSGYVGYSMSKRAEQAREAGRFPKTDFKKEYAMPEKTLQVLTEAGIISNDEWHHTSKFGNRTTFYGWNSEEAAQVYAEYKKEIDKMAKGYNSDTTTEAPASPLEVSDEYSNAKRDLESEYYKELDRIASDYENKYPDLWNGNQAAQEQRSKDFDKAKEQHEQAVLELGKQYPEDAAKIAEREKSIEESLSREEARRQNNKNTLSSLSDFFDTHEEEFTEDVRFQKKKSEDEIDRSIGIRNDSIGEEISAEVSRLSAELGTPVRIIENVSEIEDPNPRRRIEKQQSKGWFDPKTGEVVIVLPNAESKEDAVATVLHEVVAHKGLPQMMGQEAFNDFLDKVYSIIPAEVKREIAKEYGFNLQKPSDRRALADEYIASIAERGISEPSVWQKIRRFLLDALAAVGIHIDTALTDADIAYMLWQSKNRLKENATAHEQMQSTAKDRAMRKRLFGDEQVENPGIAVNDRFNRELQQQIDGTLKKGHVYQLGRPGKMLISAGVPDLPIEMAASKMSLKSSKAYESNHPFDLEDVMNLPYAIQHPIAVFDSKTQAGSKVILVELKDKKGNNFVVAMSTNVPKNRFAKVSIQINDIRSVYPKDNAQDIVSWINRGDLLKYADKKKIETWITQQRSNSAEVEIQGLDIAAKIVDDFVNPTMPDENSIRYRKKNSKKLPLRRR